MTYALEVNCRDAENAEKWAWEVGSDLRPGIGGGAMERREVNWCSEISRFGIADLATVEGSLLRSSFGGAQKFLKPNFQAG